MKVIGDVRLNEQIIETYFPCEGEEGTDVKPSVFAIAYAAGCLGVALEEVQWRAPNVFDVRYGSSYVATAFAGDVAMRFHSIEGDFQEGDDE